ncbi:MAG: BT_3928 family protein [Cyclobacteriaceae bacterium]
MQSINFIARILVGGLFIFSGMIKLNDPVGTAIKLEEYFHVFASDIAPFFVKFVPAALFLSVLLSVLEVVLGLAVLLRYRARLTSWILLLLILFFTFLTFYSAYFNKVTDCGCFGDFIKLTPWESFIKDIILLVLIVFLFVRQRHWMRATEGWARYGVIALATVICVGLGVYAINHLPYFDFRAYKVGTDVRRSMEPSAELRYKYIMEKDGEEYEFEEYPTDPAYEYKEIVLLNPEANPKITDYSVWNDEGEFTEASFEGARLLLVIHDALKADLESPPEINRLIEGLGTQVEVWVLTASQVADYENFRHEYQLAVPYFFADATVLKTMIRSNPGLILMNNGIVMGKWHFNDIPSAADIQALIR